MKNTISFICKILILLVSASVAMDASERELLFNRTKEWFAKQYVTDDPLLAMRTQKADGSWDGVSYNKKGYCPIEHLEKLKSMAMRYNQESAGGLKDSLKMTVFQGLNFWFEHDQNFVSDNWWMNDIGVLLEMNPVAFFMWDEMPNELKQKIILRNPEKSSQNATNKSWIAENVVIRGILEDRETLVSQGIRDIAQVMGIARLEGPQRDHSFFMHGNLLYNGGYGKVAVANAAKWAVITRGTSFSFSQKDLDNIADLTLGGSRWMAWKSLFDPMTIGREISRKAGNKNASGWLPILEDLMTADSIHYDQYAEWVHSVESNTDSVLHGCRYFDMGEMMICRTNDFYTSLKMSSWRNFGSEYLNRENRKGLWLGMGVLSLYKQPDDYRNIEPLWDWSLLPGITSYNESAQTEKRATNHNDYAGGFVQDDIGIAAMISDRPHIWAQKSWFIIGDKIVALGSAIESDHESAISTSVDQRRVHSKVRTTKGNLRMSSQVTSNRVWCDGIGYVALDKSNFKISRQMKSGNWRDIGTLNQQDSADVLTVWKDHGKNPKNGSYAYLVDLNAKLSKFFKTRYNVLFLNTSQYQAVLDKRRDFIAGAVYSESQFKFKNYSLYFSEPCIFLLQKTKSQYVLTVQNPTRKKETLDVIVSVSGVKSPEFGKPQKVVFESLGATAKVYFDFK